MSEGLEFESLVVPRYSASARSAEEYVLDGVGVDEVAQRGRDVGVAEDHLLGPNLNSLSIQYLVFILRYNHYIH